MYQIRIGAAHSIFSAESRETVIKLVGHFRRLERYSGLHRPVTMDRVS